ncbi:MAG: amidohydrolase family protein [Alphaproteobacteria bacterium]|nr:amidohydrolase family protein [Alphaproteobacteria bacterium]
MKKRLKQLAALATFFCTAGQGSIADTLANGKFASRFENVGHQVTVITNVTVLDGIDAQFENTSILFADGKIVAIGATIEPPENAEVIDGEGRWITPGIIDVHSHIGTTPTPEVPAHQDGNERGSPNTADVWVLHSFWPQGPGLARAAAGGVTAFQILPGSSNVIGGRTAVLKNISRVTPREMLYPGARAGVKVACGENPKKNYQSVKGAYFSRPGTRMGVVAYLRQAFYDASFYANEKNLANEEGRPFQVDLAKETLVELLEGKLSLQVHCYRADDMANILDVAEEFGVRVAAFHHAVESYKIRETLAEADTCVATWADRYGAKMEMYDGIPETAALIHAAGGCSIIHSDSDYLIQRLNQELAKALAAGQRLGLEISKAEAWRWVSYNPARLLGLAELTGSLEAGKAADLVLWSGDPFSVYSKADKVWVDGVTTYDRFDPTYQPLSDFELGQQQQEPNAPSGAKINKNGGNS